jgi:hypothetical protein
MRNDWLNVGKLFEERNNSCLQALRTHCIANPTKLCSIFSSNVASEIFKATHPEDYNLLRTTQSNAQTTTTQFAVDNIMLDKSFRKRDGIDKLLDNMILNSDNVPASILNSAFDEISHVVPSSSNVQNAVMDIKRVDANDNNVAVPSTQVNLIGTTTTASNNATPLPNDEYNTIIQKYNDRFKQLSSSPDKSFVDGIVDFLTGLWRRV